MEAWYWLNENSRTFLARGYLAEGQTAEDRVRVISDTTEKLLKSRALVTNFMNICLKVGFR